MMTRALALALLVALAFVLRLGRAWLGLLKALGVTSRQVLGVFLLEAALISTAGGITFDELDDHFMLRKLPGVFAAGEMLDWEAPTGGYLLQASFATGAAAGRGVLAWLAQSQNS